MAAGISIHVGLDAVDPTNYKGYHYPLDGAENDAWAMAGIARQRGYTVVPPFIGSNARSEDVLRELDRVVDKLRNPGDTLLFTFAGHGTFINREDDPEPRDEEEDEAWGFYDRLVFDDELYARWTRFETGVRICVVSDSCYGGGILQAFVLKAPRMRPELTLFRYIPYLEANAIYLADKTRYDGILKSVEKAQQDPVKASVILISACTEKQLAKDDSPHGLFTGKLLEVWDGGAYPGSYVNLWEYVMQAVERENPLQVPAWDEKGVSEPKFYKSKAFSF